MKPFSVVKLSDDICLQYIAKDVEKYNQSDSHNFQQKYILVKFLMDTVLEINNLAYFLRSEVYPLTQLHLPQTTEAGTPMKIYAKNDILRVVDATFDKIRACKKYINLVSSDKAFCDLLGTYYGFGANMSDMKLLVGDRRNALDNKILCYFDGNEVVLGNYGQYPLDREYKDYYTHISLEEYRNNYEIIS